MRQVVNEQHLEIRAAAVAFLRRFHFVIFERLFLAVQAEIDVLAAVRAAHHGADDTRYGTAQRARVAVFQQMIKLAEIVLSGECPIGLERCQFIQQRSRLGIVVSPLAPFDKAQGDVLELVPCIDAQLRSVVVTPERYALSLRSLVRHDFLAPW